MTVTAQALRGCATAVVVGVVLSSCSSVGGADLESAPATFTAIGERTGTASTTGGLYGDPVEAMPQVRYRIDGADDVSVADAYVRGRVVDVIEGRSFTWDLGDDVEVRRQLPFNSSEAMVSTVHLIVEIERSIVDSNQRQGDQEALSPGNSVVIGLALNAPADTEEIAKELMAKPGVAALLYTDSPVFDYDGGVWAVLNNGAYLGLVSGDQVVFPNVTAKDAPHDEPGNAQYSIEALEAPWDREPIEADYDPSSGRYTRSER